MLKTIARNALILTFLAAPVLAHTACTDECERDVDCPPGEFCSEGITAQCVECNDSGDCAVGLTCEQGDCVDPAAGRWVAEEGCGQARLTVSGNRGASGEFAYPEGSDCEECDFSGSLAPFGGGAYHGNWRFDDCPCDGATDLAVDCTLSDGALSCNLACRGGVTFTRAVGF
jgi:hypothetical protein